MSHLFLQAAALTASASVFSGPPQDFGTEGQPFMFFVKKDGEAVLAMLRSFLAKLNGFKGSQDSFAAFFEEEFAQFTEKEFGLDPETFFNDFVTFEDSFDAKAPNFDFFFFGAVSAA